MNENVEFLSKDEFNTKLEVFSQNELNNIMFNFEKNRKQYLLILKLFLLACFGMLIFSIIIQNIVLIIILIVIAIIGTLSMKTKFSSTLEKEKSSVFFSILSNLNFPLYQTNKKTTDDELSYLMDLGLVNMRDNTAVADFGGMNLLYKDNPINLYYLTLEIMGQTDDSSVYFNGNIIKAPCTKTFTGTTVIKSINSKSETSLEKVALDNTEITNYYQIYSNKPEEVKNLLNEKLIKLLIQIGLKGKNDNIELSFEKGNIHVSYVTNIEEDSPLYFSACHNIEKYQEHLYKIFSLLTVLDCAI